MRRLACPLIGSLALVGCFNPESQQGSGTQSASESGETSGSAETGNPTSLTTSTDTVDESGSTTTNPSTTSSTSVDPDSTGGSTGPAAACDEADGEPSSTCDADAPFCQDGVCVSCGGFSDGNAVCGAVDPSAPICEGGACLACTEHDQCGSGACRVANGECFPDANRLWVDNTAPNCAAGTGAMAAPFCQVTTAIAVIDMQPGVEPWAIMVAGSPTGYAGPIDPNSGRAIAIVGPMQGLAATIAGGNAYALDLWAQSPETYVARMTMTSNASTTIRGGGGCDLYLSDVALIDGPVAITTNGCAVFARRTLITDNFDTNVVVGNGGSFRASESEISNASAGMLINGDVVLDRTRVWGHYVGGGIEVNSGSLRLINSIVHQNEYTNDGIALNGGQLELLYSTVVGAVTCANGTTSTIRNSIVVGHNSEAGQVCGSADVDYSVVNVGAAQGVGNVVASAAQLPMIFVDSAQYNGNYHVLADSIPAGVAMWEAGDPEVDFDGDARPGDEDYAGADIP